MPWKESRVTEERLKFVLACQRDEETVIALCEAFGISRQTGYKWLARYQGEGLDGLRDRSRAPHHHPNQTPAAIAADVVAFKIAHDRWGPRKVHQRLREQRPRVRWPAASTMGDILHQHGLVAHRRRRRHTPPHTQPFAGCVAPNDVWCADFKGWFRTGDGRRCDPFTLTDAATRFLLRCQVVPRPDHRWVRAVMHAAFREYGLPRAIRTDNGPPFASVGLGGLSRLAIEWIKLGIVPERIAPGSPQQNARHERFHRTLNENTASPPQGDARRQQQAFDRFRPEYNYERPHEALGQKPPGVFYQRSSRPCPRHVPSIHYPETCLVRKVQRCGTIRWRGCKIHLSKPLIGEWVGLTEQEDDLWNICFGPVLLLTWDAKRRRRVRPRKERTPTPD